MRCEAEALVEGKRSLLMSITWESLGNQLLMALACELEPVYREDALAVS